MTYVPVKYVTVVKNKLIESSDLTVTLSQLVGRESYLVVTQNTFQYVLSIPQIMLLVPGLNLSAPLSTAFTLLYSDAFVARFQNPAIPLLNKSGFYENRLRVFSPMSYKDYMVHYTSVNTPDIFDNPTQKGYLDDLAISSSEDLSNCLVAVNGVFHRTSVLNNVLYALDGFRTIRLSGRKDVTLVDTSRVGGHTIIPLTTTNVKQTNYNDWATITLDQSIAGKTVFLVVDGYFYHRHSDVLMFADDTHIKVRTNKLPLIQQFRHNPRTIYQPDRYGQDVTQNSRKYLDAFEDIFLDSRSVSTSTFKTQAFQYSRLTNYHSFLVVMNSPNLYTIATDVVPTGTPQFYTDQSNRIVSGMLTYGCGLCPSYLIWKDPFERKSIFISAQDNDVDYESQTVSPLFVTSLIPDPIQAAQTHVRFIDYVSA